MGLLTLSERKRFREPATSWRWIVEMPNLGGLGRQSPYDGLSPLSQLPRGYVEQIGLPFLEIDSDDRARAAMSTFYARKINISTVSITLYEDDAYTSLRYLLTWMNKVVDGNNNYGAPSDYRKDIRFEAYDIKSRTRPKIEVDLKGCWPLNPGNIDYNYTDSGRISINCSLRVAYSKTVFR